jgi:hypothetical protein
VLPFLLLALIVTLAAQQLPVPASAPQDSSAAPQGASAAQKNKKHKKDDAADTAVFDERAAAEVLGTIRDGLEGHSQRLLLSAFDGDKMDGFATRASASRCASFRPRRKTIAALS